MNTKKQPITIISTFLFIFLCHFIIFLAFYPGICSYDLNAQIKQYVDNDFCTSHPLLHTLFIGYFHDLFISSPSNENINRGYAIATIIQLLIVDSAMTYSVIYVRSVLRKNLPAIICMVFYALFPVNSLLAISHTKDVLFAAFGLIFFIDSLRLLCPLLQNVGSLSTPTLSSLFMIRMTVNAILMILLRNNAVYAICIFAIILIILICVSNHKKQPVSLLVRYLFVVLIALTLSVTSNRLLIYRTNATPGSIKEMMSIPGQIMGRIHNTVASDEEQSLIEEYIPNTDEYNYYLADPMKHYLPFEIWESACKHFLLDTAIMSLKHPVTALQAVWYTIQGYLDPFHQPYNADRYYISFETYRGDAQLDSKIPFLHKLYNDAFAITSGYCHTPLVIPLYLGIYVWICILTLIFMIRKHTVLGSDPVYIPYVFLILYLCTLLLGPGAITRYGFIYVLTAPLSICLISHFLRNQYSHTEP